MTVLVSERVETRRHIIHVTWPSSDYCRNQGLLYAENPFFVAGVGQDVFPGTNDLRMGCSDTNGCQVA
jgi:hypothetical protein